MLIYTSFTIQLDRCASVRAWFFCATCLSATSYVAYTLETVIYRSNSGLFLRCFCGEVCLASVHYHSRRPGCCGCKRNRSIVERWRCLAAARHLYSWHIERVRCRLRCVTWIHQDSARLGSAGMHADPYISHHHLYLGAIARERGTARLQQQNANSRFVFLSAARRSDSVSCLCVSLAG